MTSTGPDGRARAHAVEILDLTMRYGETVAVDALCLDVYRGSVTSILGPNGAGKTTTIETCEGFRRAQNGHVRILGLDPVRDAKELRPRVGVMLQSGGAWAGVKAREMLQHMAAMYQTPLPLDLLLSRLGLHECQHTPYRRLSGGQQQRLGLAMAVVGRPELVFLDEPSAGLDPQARHATWELITELQDSGVTVVLTTHFMEEAEVLSDIVHIVDHGKIIASGPPRELVATHARNTIRLETQTELNMMSLRAALPPQTRIEELADSKYLLTADVTPSLLATVTSWCAAEGVMVESMLVERKTLEDTFLDLTGRSLR